MMKTINEEQEQRPVRRPRGRRTIALGTATLAVMALSATTYFSWAAPQEKTAATRGTSASIESKASAAPEAGPSVSSAAPAAPTKSVTAARPAGKPDHPLPPDHAQARIKKFLDVSVPVDPAAPGPKTELEDAARGAILAEVENDSQELKANGWSRRGNASVGTVTIISSDIESDPATTIAQACVDSSNVVTLDSSKKPVGASGKGVQRALNIYTLHYISDEWRVVARSFPDNPAC